MGLITVGVIVVIGISGCLGYKLIYDSCVNTNRENYVLQINDNEDTELPPKYDDIN